MIDRTGVTTNHTWYLHAVIVVPFLLHPNLASPSLNGEVTLSSRLKSSKLLHFSTLLLGAVFLVVAAQQTQVWQHWM
jgi:hypothetical protein